MVRLTWTQGALDGLIQIAEYIAVSNPYAAKKLVQTVFGISGEVRCCLSAI